MRKLTEVTKIGIFSQKCLILVSSGLTCRLDCIKALSCRLAALSMQIGKKSNTKTSLLKMLNKGYLSTFSSLVSSSLVFLYFYSFFIVFFSFFLFQQLNLTSSSILLTATILLLEGL